MMPADQPIDVTRVIGAANDLGLMLRGAGYPRVSAGAVVDGKSVKDALLGLENTIESFLGLTPTLDQIREENQKLHWLVKRLFDQVDELKGELTGISTRE